MKVNRHLLRLFMAAIAPLTLLSQPAVAEDFESAERACTVINAMGSSIECSVNNSAHAIALMADMTEVDAVEFCTTFARMVAPVTTTLSRDWKMRVFATQDADTPAAVCDLR